MLRSYDVTILFWATDPFWSCGNTWNCKKEDQSTWNKFRHFHVSKLFLNIYEPETV